MKLNDGLFKVKIEVGEAFGAKSEDLTLTFREPTYEEQTELMTKLSKDGETHIMFWKKKFSFLLTEWEGFTDEGKEFSKDEIIAEIKKRGTLYTFLMTTYFTELNEHISPEKKRVSNDSNKDED